ncbi:integrin alpha-PS2-like [Diaphorina citri]|uniref:Integrin alpha-PS2-like n=1 Tax=Diaphorina citri TaxID=121845 RepID=A0A3Q0IT34_DIACI|nr:integrin alpha-PS2-like [Diaphorina citri]
MLHQVLLHQELHHTYSYCPLLDAALALSTFHVNSSLCYRVLVGAPEAQTTQPGVTRGGAVYRCDISRDDSCQEVPFDTTGNNNNSRGVQVDKKSYQWFGASLATSGENGVVVACAPRYVWYSIGEKHREPVGTCYVSKNQFTDFSEYSPCRTRRGWGYHKQGTCQAGLGVSISKDGQRLFIGAPGSYFWQGQLFSIDSNEPIYFPPYYSPLMDLEPGQVISQNLYDRPEFKATKEGPPTDDGSYMGYSVASGFFSGESGVAVGIPRGARLLGKVALYTTNMTNLQNITGEQLGAYFAYAVTTSDVDGDGADDLIIGAPLYTNPTNNVGHYETGRIYVVYQGKETYKFRRLHTRDGKNSKARFGLSLCNLGDINKDGFGDFAVGAPYDGPNERGVVYIYHGSPIGARENPSQIITAEEVNFGLQGSLTTFGFSLAGGVDLDENQYPDLVIGAYESNTAFVLRSRPVVKVKSSLSFSSDSKQIFLEEKNCTLKDYSKVTCLTLTACLEYNGVGVDPQTELNVQILLDSKKPKSPRMFFLSDEGKNVINQTLLLIKGTQFCKSTVDMVCEAERPLCTPITPAVSKWALVTNVVDVYELRPRLAFFCDGFGLVQTRVVMKMGTVNSCMLSDTVVVTSGEDKGVTYVEEKSSSFSSSQKSSGGKKKEGKAYAATSGVQYSGAQGKQFAAGATGTGFGGVTNVQQNAGGVTNVQQNAGGKIAYETSVADLAAASNQGSATRTEGNESIRTNVIEDHVIQYGTIGNVPEVDSTYHQGGNAGGYSSGSGYSASGGSNVGYSASAGSNVGYSSSGGGNVGYSAGASRSGAGFATIDSGYSAGDSRFAAGSAGGARYGGSSLSSEANAAWAQAGEKATGINLDVNIGTDSVSIQKNCGKDNVCIPDLRLTSVPNVNRYILGSGERMEVDVLVKNEGEDSFETSYEMGVPLGLNYVNIERYDEGDRDIPILCSAPSYLNNNTLHCDIGNPLPSKKFVHFKVLLQPSFQETLKPRYEFWMSVNSTNPEVATTVSDNIQELTVPIWVETDLIVEGKQSWTGDGRACGPTKCIKIKCNVGALQKDQEAWVAFRSRVWIPTIRKIAPNKEVSLSSLLVARVTKIPHIGTPDQATIKTHEIFTKVIPRETGVPPGMVPLWVVVLSAVAGAIILMLLVYLLYKWGFFKRRRPNDVPEKEPLNRNGYQHGED